MPAPALPNLLLVEGTSDQLFFRALCKTLGLDTRTTVKVAPPRELQASAFNTKQGVLNHLPVLLRQLDDGQLRHLGVVIDADSPPDGGFPATRDRITRDLAGFGYSLKPEHPHSAGLLFVHDDEAEICELDCLVEQRMGADGDVHRAVGDALFHRFEIGRGDEARGLADIHRPAHRSQGGEGGYRMAHFCTASICVMRCTEVGMPIFTR